MTPASEITATTAAETVIPTFKTLRIVRPSAHVAQVLLTSDRKGNPFGMELWDEIPLAFRALDADPTVRVIVLATLAPHFTYGLDVASVAPHLMAMAAGGASERAAFIAFGQRWQAALGAVAEIRAPVIAAVNGWCIGAGVELIAACDIRVCSSDAKFSLREVKVGIVPDVGGLQRLPFLIGEGPARQLAMTGEDIDATAAKSYGLVNSVHADAAAALEAAMVIAEQIAANAPLVVQGVKRVMNTRIQAAVDASMLHALQVNAALIQTQDFTEVMGAMLQRRAPVFAGK